MFHCCALPPHPRVALSSYSRIIPHLGQSHIHLVVSRTLRTLPPWYGLGRIYCDSFGNIPTYSLCYVFRRIISFEFWASILALEYYIMVLLFSSRSSLIFLFLGLWFVRKVRNLARLLQHTSQVLQRQISLCSRLLLGLSVYLLARYSRYPHRNFHHSSAVKYNRKRPVAQVRLLRRIVDGT